MKIRFNTLLLQLRKGEFWFKAAYPSLPSTPAAHKHMQQRKCARFGCILNKVIPKSILLAWIENLIRLDREVCIFWHGVCVCASELMSRYSVCQQDNWGLCVWCHLTIIAWAHMGDPAMSKATNWASMSMCVYDTETVSLLADQSRLHLSSCCESFHPISKIGYIQSDHNILCIFNEIQFD